jgi:hypothetical protein
MATLNERKRRTHRLAAHDWFDFELAAEYHRLSKPGFLSAPNISDGRPFFGLGRLRGWHPWGRSQ